MIERNRLKLSSNHNYKNDQEMLKLFSDLPEALLNNFYLPYKCNFKANYSKPLLPEISSNSETGTDKILEEQAIKGLEEKFSNNLVTINNDINKDDIFNKYKQRR